ncbi:MAG: hypothetical protein ACJ71O_03295, partial [Nitrososphaeraceae archaeon]
MTENLRASCQKDDMSAGTIYSSKKTAFENEQTNKGYTINPGSNDGIADSFGKGDIWFLRNRPNQFDHGVQTIGPPYEAQEYC